MYLIDREDVECKAFAGAAYPLDKLCMVYPAKVKEVIAMGHKVYNRRLNLLITEEKDLLELFKSKGINIDNIDVFDNLMESCMNKDFLLELQSAFRTFIREQVIILPETKTILIGEEKSRIMDKDGFYNFQKVLRIQNRVQIISEEIPENETPMQRKFRLRREQLKIAKRKQKSKNGEGDALGFLEIMSSVSVGLKLSTSQIMDMTIYDLHDKFERMMEKQKFDMDIRSVIAGADIKKVKPKNWARKIDVNE